MKNNIFIDEPIIKDNTIHYCYHVEGEWNSIFTSTEFVISYSFDISALPPSIAVIPLLSQILPIAWVCDAVIHVPRCDEDFFNCIPDFKIGYEKMYPMLAFKGEIIADRIEKNPVRGEKAGLLFSGGADAIFSLISHIGEKPILVSLWGSDIAYENESGWIPVQNNIIRTAEELGVDPAFVHTSFRKNIVYWRCDRRVEESGDTWWHGFQHGIGIISHAAPVAWAFGCRMIYIASSFSPEFTGKVTCASDPLIDNHIRFCGAQVIHDGYDYNRQSKIDEIIRYTKLEKKQISMRVCFKSTNGDNCCRCEKCFRTMLSIWGDGEEPQHYGFSYSEKDLEYVSEQIFKKDPDVYGRMRYYVYKVIQEKMRRSIRKSDLPDSIRWFYLASLRDKGQIGIKLKARVIDWWLKTTGRVVLYLK